jgi:hypothetical protein
MTNCLVYGNRSDVGVRTDSQPVSDSIIENCIIWGNRDSEGTSAPNSPIDWSPTGPFRLTVRNSIIEDFDASTNVLFENIIRLNPQWVDPENGDFRLTPASPALDRGVWVEGMSPTDIDGNPRPYIAIPWETRGDGSGVDIGPYEFQRPVSDERQGLQLY